jgi:hypothetical protein
LVGVRVPLRALAHRSGHDWVAVIGSGTASQT